MATGNHQIPGRGAFTLIEIVAVLAIGAMLLGVGGIVLHQAGSAGELKIAVGQVEATARRAASLALTTGQAHAVTFAEGQLEVTPVELAAAGPTPIGDPAFSQKIAAEIQLKTRPWQAEGWADAGETPWVFQPGGVSLPMSVRVQLGEGYLDLAFAALGGAVQEKEGLLK